MEMLAGPKRRRRWSVEYKLAMVLESFEQGRSVTMVACQHGVSRNLLFQWRKLYRNGGLSAVKVSEEVVPASDLADALRQIQDLRLLLDEMTMENSLLREAVEYGQARKEIARSPLPPEDGE